MAELRKVRNIKPGFKRGLWFGLLNAAWETLTNGASPWTLRNKPDWSSLDKVGGHEQPKRDYVQRALPPRDRLQGVYFAATEHDEDQPVHLVVHDTSICIERCTVEYDNPCTRFCPANVYEIVEDTATDGGTARTPADQRRQLRALQDMRHQGSLRDHHLGAAGRRLRTQLPESVMQATA
jgi:electron-transferring-flavoprotein dehydrogenase